MTEKQARYFIEVYEKRNIALAAEELYVSRPVVSRAISELEREFDAQLFLRSSTGVVPTDAGIMVYRMVCDMAASYNAVSANIKNSENVTPNRVLRFGVTPTNASRIYDILLRGFLQRFPDVRLNIVEKPAGESIDLLFNGSADIVFTPQEIDGTCLEYMDGYQTRFALGIALSSPLATKSILSISDIFDVNFGSLSAPLPLEELLHSCFSSFGKRPNIAVRSTSLELLRKMVQDGRIAVVLPDYMMIDWDESAVIPLDFTRVSTHKLVWNKFVTHNSVLSDLLTYAKQIFGDVCNLSEGRREK